MGKAKEKIGLIIKKGEEVEVEVRSKIAGYITAGLGVVAGLAWNDAIKAFIEEFFPQENSNLLAKFAYAVIITIAVVIISLYLVKLLRTEQKKENKKETKTQE
jgi:Na+/proline symporter